MKILKIIFMSIALAGASPALGQFSFFSDSLNRILAHLPIERQIDSLNEWSYFSFDDDIARKNFATAALILAQKQNDQPRIATSYMRLSLVPSDSIAYYTNQACQIRKQLNDEIGVLNCQLRLSQIYDAQGKLDEAIAIIKEAIASFKNQPPRPVLGKLYNSLGLAYMKMGYYNNADETFDISIQIYQKIEPLSETEKKDIELALLFVHHNKIANLQDNLQIYEDQSPFLLQTIAKIDTSYKGLIAKYYILLGNSAFLRKNLDDALQYYNEANALVLDNEPEIKFQLSEIFGNLYYEKREYKKARKYFQAAIDSFITIDPEHPSIIICTVGIGNTYYEEDNLSNALLYYSKVIEDTSRIKDRYQLYTYFLSLRDILRELGKKEEATNYEQAANRLLKNLNSMEISRFIRFHKDQEERFKARQRFEGKQNRYIVTILIVVCMSLGLAVLALLFILKQRSKIAAQEKIETLRRMEAESNDARVAGQNDMQRKMGRELHDNIGAMLSVVKLNLAPVDDVLHLLSDKKRNQCELGLQQLDAACQEVRRLSHELAAYNQSEFGLKVQLEDLATVLPTTSNIAVELYTHGLSDRMNARLELAIYRIIQELIHNIIKHARANKVIIQVNHFDDLVNILIEDDGIGFDVNKELAKREGGIGLKNIFSRVKELDGEILFNSRPGRGTTVSIDFPVNVKIAA